MDILNEIKFTEPTLVSVGGKPAVGKTTVLIAMVKNMVRVGDKVIVISDDKPTKWISKFLGLPEVKFFFLTYDQIKQLPTIVGDNDCDFLILDIAKTLTAIELLELKNFASSKNIITFTSFQTYYNLNAQLNGYHNQKIMQYSDYVIDITRNPKFKWWEQLKYFFLPFWFKKPNASISVIKNRFGSNGTENVYINYETATIN
jgi:GTPase SAR1 family protein